MNSKAETEQLLQDAVEALGYEFVGCEFISSQGNTLIRVYIDRAEGGVTISDCVSATHQIRGVLEVAHNSKEDATQFTSVNEEADERRQGRYKKKDIKEDSRSIFSYSQASREEGTQFTSVNEEADERRQGRYKKKDIKEDSRSIFSYSQASREEGTQFTSVNEEADERRQGRDKKKDSKENSRSIFSYSQASREEGTQFTSVNEEADERRQRRYKKKDPGYTLEVSSPGLDRPLFQLKHFSQFEGRKARVQLKQLIEQRRDITGCITKVIGTTLQLKENDKIYNIEHSNIKKANLVE